MLLQLQKYLFTLHYKPGKEMILADTLLHACIKDCTMSQSTLEEELACVVHMVLSTAPFSDDKLEEVRKAMSEDTALRLLQTTIQTGWPELKEFWTYQDELSKADGRVLKEEKILIPQSRSDMLNRMHTSHLGEIKCKERAKDVLFWPGIGKQAEETIATCKKCLEHQMSNTKEPMTIGELPSRPWQIVTTNLFHFKGCDYLLLVDYYSRFFETIKLTDTTAKTVICYTKSIFARHGIPNVLKSDIGPQFTSDEFKQFSSQWEFFHILVSPYHPQANGLAENVYK